MTHAIVIVGAGYAGLAAAHRLGRLLADQDATITLINSRDRFIERIRLHQVAAGQQLSPLPLRDILRGTEVRVLVATVTGIDLADRRVRTAAGDAIAYDTLVYALGSVGDTGGAPGSGEHALTVADQASAEQLKDRIAGLATGSNVSVVGGGLTGIEVASELADSHRHLTVRLITSGAFGRWLAPKGERHLREALDRLGVEVIENARVEEVGSDKIITEVGVLPSEATVWAAGFRVPRIAAEAGLEVDDRGRMRVDASLRSVSHPEVYGIGDAAAATTTPGGAESRMSCQTGLPMGLQAGRIIANRVTGKRARATWVRYVWINISLGRRDGVTQFTHADDRPLPWVMTGRASARFKELISRGTVTELRHPWLIPDFPTRHVP